MMNYLYEADKKRNKSVYVLILLNLLRASQKSHNPFIRQIAKSLFYKFSALHGIEIGHTCSIGSGFFIGHPYNITINPSVVIGESCNIHKNALIGQENRGRRKGTPVIGNSVWIGINAVIVGKITIGDDVLIAPNSYVNCDVPSHSVVFGNPCIIKRKTFATEGYIHNVE